ncbi:MAG: S1/P1 nuclease [Armatimonadetes bacterium]|nr:S1/P1 nuclease [Armatimonadota bacterium]
MRRLLFLMILLIPAPAHAWNKAGHMLVAAVAFPELPPAVSATLRSHPHYGKWIAQARRKGVPDQQRDLFVAMMAARWPDDIRDDARYNHLYWHFINYPYVIGNAPTPSDLPNRRENVELAIASNLATYRNARAAPRERAIALAWLFHLVGDIHMPLHAVSSVSRDYPHGDRGATRYYVLPERGTKPVSLHLYWDAVVIGTERFSQVRNEAGALRASLKRGAFAQLRCATTPHEWAREESYRLAVRDAYRHGAIQGSTDAEHATPLPIGYGKAAKAVARRQLVLSAYRLADLLNRP